MSRRELLFVSGSLLVVLVLAAAVLVLLDREPGVRGSPPSAADERAGLEGAAADEGALLGGESEERLEAAVRGSPSSEGGTIDQASLKGDGAATEHPPPAYSISGSVECPDPDELSRVTVFCRRWEEGAAPTREVSHSDSQRLEGDSFLFVLDRPGTYQLGLMRGQSMAMSRSVEVSGREVVDLVLPEMDELIIAHVQDSAGEPVVAVNVMCTYEYRGEEGGMRGAYVVSQEKGLFKVLAPDVVRRVIRGDVEGECRLGFSGTNDEGFREVVLEPGAGFGRVDVVLRPSVSLHVTVSGLDERLIGRVRVEVYDDERLRRKRHVEPVDEAGQAELVGLPRGELLAAVAVNVAMDDGPKEVWFRGVAKPFDATVQRTLEMAVPELFDLQVHSIPDGVIMLRSAPNENGGASDVLAVRARADSAGVCRFPLLPRGLYLVQVSGGQEGASEVRVPEQAVITVN